MAMWAALLAGGCTPNGIGVAGGNGGGGGVTHVVDENLTQSVNVKTPYGESGAIKPSVLDVNVGDSIVFMNTDSFPHTSTWVGDGPAFPSNGPNAGALTQRGTTLSGGWSSGAMPAGSGSQKILADKPGTYLYGCFFHYPAPMRAAIVVH
jgi:plastocyanin